MKSPLLAEEFVHGSRVYLDKMKPYQLFVDAPDRAFLIVTMWRAEWKKKHLGGKGDVQGPANRKKNPQRKQNERLAAPSFSAPTYVH